MDQNELFPDNILNDPQYVADGRVTDHGMEELRKRMPHANLESFESDRSVDGFSNIFTVDTIARFVQSKLD